MDTSVLLREVLLIVIQNAGPMVGVYWLLERPFMDRLFGKASAFIQDELGLSVAAVKRWTALLISTLVSTALYVLLAALGYEVMPITFEQWANVVLTVGAINFTGTQLIHSKDLRDR